MTDAPCKTKPDIEYPCDWIYRIIGADEAALRELIASLVDNRKHEVRLSNRSAGGKYSSLQLTVTVADEAERLQLFQQLSDHPTVKIVL